MASKLHKVEKPDVSLEQVLDYFQIPSDTVDRVDEWLLRQMDTAAKDLDFDQLQKREALLYSGLYFAYYAIRIVAQIELQDAPAGASPELLHQIEARLSAQEAESRKWVARMFLEIQLAALQSEPELSALQLLCDMEDHLLLRHSLTGAHAVGLCEVMLLSYLRRNLGFAAADNLVEMGKPFGLEFKNLRRVLEFLMAAHGVGYAAMDKKEATLFENLNSLTSQRDFIEAVTRGDIEECRQIL